jgi:hypothetical protein
MMSVIKPNVIMLSVEMLSVVILSVVMLNTFMMIVTYKAFMLCHYAECRPAESHLLNPLR